MKRPWCWVPALLDILKTTFCRLVACDVGQWIPVAEVDAGMAVISMTKFLICRQKILVAPHGNAPPAWYGAPSMTPKPVKDGVAFRMGLLFGFPTRCVA